MTINIPGSTMLIKLQEIFEEIYGRAIEEYTSRNFSDIGKINEALKQGYTLKNWVRYKPRRDYQGFSSGDDLFIALLLKTEKVFNITIKDEEAEKIKTLEDWNDYVNRRTKEDK